jgi:hypothetical protein
VKLATGREVGAKSRARTTTTTRRRSRSRRRRRRRIVQGIERRSRW